MDGHTSHLTPFLTFKENKIVVIRLFPNATHLMQPLDIVVFHSLKLTWKKAVHDWRIQHCHEKQKKERFCPLQEKMLRTVMPSMLVNGLRKCGLHPWRPNNIDCSKTVHNNLESPVRQEIQQEISKTEIK